MTSTKTVGPVITRIEGSGVDIPDGGTTEATMVEIFGTATPRRIVKLLDNGSSPGSATVSESGDWFFPWDGVVVGDHEMKANTVDGTSLAWTFTVKTPQKKR
ncbi:hypothetical protein [Pseudomonas sp. RT6P73]